MPARIVSLRRHPVKGFTPERLSAARLEAGAAFPCDRLYAVENGPSGFDPAVPTHIPKTRFTVLAAIPTLARARTRYDEATATLSVQAEGEAAFSACLEEEAGRDAFAAWLTDFIASEDRRGPLKVLRAAGAYRFMDYEAGAVSLINLASLRDLEERLGRAVDPLRFRANLYVDGWPAWAELELEPGATVRIGDAVARVVKPIVRCAATHVDPQTGVRDIELTAALHEHYGRLTCGIYLQVEQGGAVGEGTPVSAED